MDIFSRIEKERGMVARIYSDFKGFPESVAAHFGLNKAILLSSSAPLSRDERELLAFRTSEENGNAYCASHHRKAYENFKGISAKGEKGAPLLERLAVTLSSAPHEASKLKSEFVTAGFTEAEWQHAVNIVAYFNYTNRLAFAMNMELEEGYEKSCN